MNKKHIRGKLLTFLTIMTTTTLICESASSPFNYPHNPSLQVIHNPNGWIEHKLIELIKSVVEAKRYWMGLEDNMFRRAVTRPVHHWWKFSWATEIDEHLSYLNELEKQLAISLSNHVKGIQSDRSEIYTTITQANAILADHGIPLHIVRNWLFYGASALVCVKLFQELNDYCNRHVQFTFDHKADTKTIVDATRYCKHPCSISSISEGIIVTCSEKYKKEFERELAKDNFREYRDDSEDERTVLSYQVRPTYYKDLGLIFLDENGKFIGRKFLQVCCTDPLKKIWAKLMKKHSPSVTNPNVNKMVTARRTEAMQECLTFAVTEKDVHEDIRRAYTRNNNSFEGIPQEKLEELIALVNVDVLNAFFSRLGQIIAENQEIPGWIKSTAGMLGLGSKLPQAPKPEKTPQKTPTNAAPATQAAQPTSSEAEKAALSQQQIAYANYVMRTAQRMFPTLREQVENTIDATEYLSESAKLTPFLLVVYLSYKGARSLYDYQHSYFFKKPMRSDLKDFIHFLHQHAHTENDPVFDGLYYYWITRIRSYVGYMSKETRVTLKRDLENLIQTKTTEEKLQILETMLYNEFPQF